MHWSAQFIGTLYEEFGRERSGCDCWGLVYVVFRDQLGISLPTYSGQYASAEERGEISALISDAAVSAVWRRIESGFQDFDIAVFRRGRMDAHVGIVIAPNLMLHMANEDCAKIERFDQAAWKNRLTGIYRHFKLASKVA